MANLGQQGVLQVMSPDELNASEAAANAQYAQEKDAASKPVDVQPLAGYIKGQFEIFRNHRNTQSGWSERLLKALRTFNGQYDPTTLQEIKKFGGSEVYARVIAQKCRAASSLLRDIYLGQDQPWSLKPPEAPAIPAQIVQRIEQLIQQEAQMVAQTTGQPPDPTDLGDRKRALMDQAQDMAKKKATAQARDADDKVETILRDGGFYHALAEFLVDLPIFPFACIKGPVVKVVPEVVWPPGGGQPTVKQNPKLTWNRVSPFDRYLPILTASAPQSQRQSQNVRLDAGLGALRRTASFPNRWPVRFMAVVFMIY